MVEDTTESKTNTNLETTETPTNDDTTPIEPNDGYTMPFDEDTPDEAIDIPIVDEDANKVHYKHFWQDPDFSPIDRFKTYWETASEKYKNRKRSGEVHIEIKSNPETAILFADLKNKVLAEEELQKSREEFHKQVQDGEYDGYEYVPSKDTYEEPTFENTSINDFNSYEDKEKVLEQISETKTSIFVRTTIIAILCIISVYIALANDLGLPILNMLDTNISVSGYLMVQSACGLIAILTSIKSVISGIVKVFKRVADSDSFSAVGIVSAFVTSLVVFLLSDKVSDVQMLNIYMPVALLGMLCNLYGKSLIVKREEYNFKYISKDKQKCGLFCMQDDYDAEQFTKGLVEDYPVTAYKRNANFTKDFIKYTYSYDMADRFSKYAVPIIGIVSLVVALISALFYNTSFGMIFPIGFVSIFSMLVSFCSCFSIPIYINSMLYRVSKKYAKREGVLLGYQSVEDFYDTNSMVISSKDVFPKGSIHLSALKLFSNAKVDETLVYAISLAKKVDSILAPTLLEILDGNLDLLCDVENCSYEDGLGICGWIDNKRVIMGNRELMELHNIENLPTKSKEAELVGSRRDCIYVSVSGNLSLMLIVELSANKKVTKDLNRIQSHGIAIAVTSSDFLVSINKLSYLFGIDPESVKIIPNSVFEKAKDYFTDMEGCSTSIVTSNDIGTVASMLVHTKKIHAKAVIGNVLNAVSCIVGIIIGISFITMGGFRELTSTMILVYNLICCAITLIICNNKRF
jgi:Cu+-exporting ATPase